MLDIDLLSKDLMDLNNHRKIAREYGVFSREVSVPLYGAKPREFLVFSLERISQDVSPIAIINRNERNPMLFYPKDFAVELHKENPLLLWEKVARYIAHAEFMFEIYGQYHTPLPKMIRADELDALVSFYNGAQNSTFSEQSRREYSEGLRKFFKDENPKTKFKKDWKDFYRSELYSRNQTFFKNLILLQSFMRCINLDV